MKRFLPLLLVLIAGGCSNAKGGTLWPDPRPKQAAPVEIIEPKPPITSDPVPPTPAPLPVPCPPATICPTCPEPIADEEPSLSLPASVIVKSGSWIKISGKTNGKEIRWYSPDEDISPFPAGTLKDPLATVIFGGTVGTYRLVGHTAVGGIPSDSIEMSVIVVPKSGPAPAPPAPGPGPSPAPTPSVVTASRLYVVLIDDVTARSPQLSAIFTNMGFWKSVNASGHQYAEINPTDKQQFAMFTAQITAAGGLPLVVIMDASNGTWLNRSPADLKIPLDTPPTPPGTALAALINKYVKR